MRPNLLSLTILLSVALLAGCASTQPEQPSMSTQGTTLVQTAQITDIRDVTIRGGGPSFLGSFIGSLLGGIAGSKFGSGNGSATAALGGAVIGGMAGHRIGESSASTRMTELTLRFDNGEVRTLQVEPRGAYRIGSLVKVSTNRGVMRLEP